MHHITHHTTHHTRLRRLTLAAVPALADADGVVDGGRNTASGNGEGDCIGVSC